MHLEVLVEDSSGATLIGHLLPRILGPKDEPHTWKIRPYKGLGHLPKGLSPRTDPSKRILLDQLPRLLQGYGKQPGIDLVVVVVDSDRRDCKTFLRELQAVLENCNPAPNTLFRLAIEEIEAWYLGDRKAILAAYPHAKQEVLNRYDQDSVCGTWEVLADATYPDGSAAVKKAGGYKPGELKHEWADRIGKAMDLEANLSPSFCKFREGIRRHIPSQ
jgi:hypothetical protein